MLGKTRWRKRLKTHGFLFRMSTAGGRRLIKRRRSKGRHCLAPQKKA